MKPTLYLETSIPSYLASWPSRDLVVAGHQQVTKEWWARRRDAFDVYVSQFVIDEAQSGDARAARDRLKLVRGLPLLEITPLVDTLAADLLALGVMPRRAVVDAAHIAVAAVHSMDFLMTWNCTHIANAAMTRRVVAVCRRHGLECPVICTPEELMGV
ncbi:MAG: type II toxin-antitoxin system VapC family toxin [Candidatus Hydrogenedentes bacterium]|nr:type II toxin-antitoxin system VapC family toxin [Candidatus Hydrogenedentota bacterium]